MSTHLNKRFFVVILLLALLLACPQEMDLYEAPAFGMVMNEAGYSIENVKVHGSRSGANVMDSLLLDFHEQQFTDGSGIFSLGACVRERYAVKNSGCDDSERVLDEIVDFEMAFTHAGYDTLIVAFVRYNSDTTAYVHPYLSQVDSIIHIEEIAWEKVDDAYELLPFTLREKVAN